MIVPTLRMTLSSASSVKRRLWKFLDIDNSSDQKSHHRLCINELAVMYNSEMSQMTIFSNVLFIGGC